MSLKANGTNEEEIITLETLNADPESDVQVNEDELNEEEENLGILRPPDGGFGWVVVGAAFMTSIIVDGIIFSFGILLPAILEEFGKDKSTTSWVGSILSGAYLLIGPVVSALTNKFGCRKIAIIGSFIACSGFIGASFAESIPSLIVTYGLIGGIGFGFVYLPSIVIIPVYFEKRRAFATGIAVCGSGIGTFIFSPLSQYLIDEYSWRGMLLIQAGIILNCCVFCMAFLPLEKVISIPKCQDSPTIKPLLLRTKEARDQWQRISIASGMTDEESVLAIVQNGNASKVSVDTNENVPTRKEPTEDSPDSMPMLENNSFSRLKKDNGLQRRRIRSQIIIYNDDDANKKISCMNFPWWHPLPPVPVIPKVTSADLTRPFYRPDIFFSGSLMQICSRNEKTNYNSKLFLNGLQDETDGVEDSMRMRDTFKAILDFSLLARPTFIIICISGFLTFLGFFIPFIYISDFALTTGIDKNKVSFLLSLIGIGNTIGRVFCGWVSDQPWASALYINSVALILAGVATALVPYCVIYETQLLYSIVFGLTIACFVSLRSIILVEYHGVDKLPNAFGLTMLFQGTASVIGPPLAGWLYNLSNSYSLSFNIAGLIIAISGAVYLPIPWVYRKWEENKTEIKAV